MLSGPDVVFGRMCSYLLGSKASIFVLFSILLGTVCQEDGIPLRIEDFLFSNVRGLGYEYPRYSFPSADTKVSPRWLVVAGRQVVPGSVYRVVVQVIKRSTESTEPPLTVRASISHNQQQITFGKAFVYPGELSHILLQIPDTSIYGSWQLRIEGREGKSQLPVFKNTTTLRFTPQFLTILIQTSRPVYNAGQTVRFRGVMLTRELRPYEEPVDVFVLDPRGLIMRRWPSHQTGDGVINMQFDLPEYPELGNWTIQVQARQQVQNKTIVVEQYFQPRFEVFVRLPHTFKVTDEFIEGVVVANMTNWRGVYGNCSVELQIATNHDFPIPTEFETVHKEFIQNFTSFYPFRIPMLSVANRLSDLNDVMIRVFARVGDAFNWRIQHGFALARIIKEEAMISFLGDQPLFFKPGMPVSVHVFVSYKDGHPFEEEKFEGSELLITFRSSKSISILVNGTELQDNGGSYKAVAEIPSDASSLEISANFIGNDSLSAYATLTAILHHSPRDHQLQVETSTSDVEPGQNIVLHVRSNFFVDYINYMIVSNGLVIYNGREGVEDSSYPTVTTFALPASAEMSPVAKILVWVVDPFYEIVADSVAIPVSPLAKHEVALRWNEHKDHSGGTVEVKMIGDTGAFFATSAIWEETYKMDAGNDFDAARILNHMLGFHDSGQIYTEEIIPHIRRASTRSREGLGSNVRFFSTPNMGPDAPTTFNFSDVILFTDAMIYYHPSKSTDAPLCEEGRKPCLSGGCYSLEERCDGYPNCADSSDESGCPVNIDPLGQFRLYRVSRLHRFYDPDYGDWAWEDIRPIGGEIQVFTIYKRPQNWFFSMFAVGKQNGLGIIEQKIQFDSPGPFLLFLEAPKVARMWEQVALTVSVFNFHTDLVAAMITLPYSEDYQTIQVEANGVVQSYAPRRIEGVFQHVVWLLPGSSVDVNIPIVFKRMGTIEVTVVGSTQMQKDSETISIEVIPEGAVIGQHSSVILDLKSRSIAYEFLDIHLDETPVVSYQIERKYIFSTPSGSISVTGDVVGPAFPDIPVSESSLIGFGSIGAETYAYNFGANIWSLHYLRLTNQLTNDITYKVLTAVNVDYAALARHQTANGGFSNWIGSEESVWLTAYSLKTLWAANFQDWENYIFIDQKLVRRGVQWLLQFQTDLGSFTETEFYIHPLDPKVDPRGRESWMPKYQNISLTAHVVIALETVKTGLEGDLHKTANLAKQRAVRYLEKMLPTLMDPYDLALVTWALIKGSSEEVNVAFNSLNKIKRVVGDRIYWSREPVSFNELIFEDSQKPFLQVKSDNRWDAHAVETTAYALLVYIRSDGIGIIQENIVRFLNSMREMDGGMISSIDSLVALEALVEYSYRARIRDITDMHIEIQQSADPNTTIYTTLKDVANLAQIETFDLNGVFGHLSVVGRGAGQALIQLSYSYGVDVAAELNQPPLEAFEFELRAQFNGFNNSYVTVHSCQRWVNTNETETSGLTVVDIHLPSGYYIMQDELIEMVESKQVRNLRWAQRTDTKVKFFFNHLDNETICFSYRLERWYPVSNHSRYNLGFIYELYQPERFKEILFETYPLYSLDICEVCGSYQCPYCPFYSDAPVKRATLSIVLVSFIISKLFVSFWS